MAVRATQLRYSRLGNWLIRAAAFLICLLLGPEIGKPSAANTQGAPSIVQTPAGCVAQTESVALRLEPGKAVEKELAGGATDTYEIQVGVGQFFHAVVEQMGIDAGLALCEPDGKQIASAGGRSKSVGLEQLSMIGLQQISTIAESSGTYKLQVVSGDKDVPAGRYRVTLSPLSAPRDEDRSRIAAERLFTEAEELKKQESADGYRAAIQKLLQTRPLWRAAGDRYEEALTLQSLGTIQNRVGERQNALDSYNEAVGLWRAVGDRAGEAMTVGDLGVVHNMLGERQKALDCYNQALALARAVGNHSAEAAVLTGIGVVYAALEEKQTALDYYNQALPLWHKMKSAYGEARTFMDMGYVYLSLGEKQKALDYYNDALPLWRAAGYRFGEAMTLNDLGSTYSGLGEHQKALDYLNQALGLEREVGDRAGVATSLSLIGSLYHAIGENQKALDYFNHALPLRRAVRDRSGEAGTLLDMGIVYDALGEKQKALDYYNQALTLRHAVGDRSGEAVTLENIGYCYFTLGEHQKALDYYNQALRLEREVGNQAGIAMSLHDIGFFYYALRDNQKALDYFNQALPLRRAVGDRTGEAWALNDIGLVYSALGQKDKALSYYDQALLLQRSVGNRSGEATALTNIGLLEEKDKALDYYNQALPLERALGERLKEAWTLGTIEAVLRRSDPNLAIAFGKQAVNLVQTVRRDNQGLEDTLRAGLDKSIEYLYRSLATLLIERERFGEAEEVLNLLKDKEARDFIRRDLVSEQLHSATLLDFEKKALDRYDEIVNQIISLGQRKAALVAKKNEAPLSAGELAEENRLDADLRAANIVLLRFFEEQQKSFAADSAQASRVEEFKEAEGLQDALQRLGPDVVAIYTLVTPDKYLAMLVTSGARKAYSSSIREEELNREIFNFRQQLQNPSSNPVPLAQDLYRMVFPENLRQDLESMHAKTIMWSVDSTLRYIPFSALNDGKQYLIEVFRQSLITPASIAYLTEEPIRQWSGEGFGVSESASPLPSVPAELRGIFRETPGSKAPVPGVIRLNAAFTRQSFESDLRQKRNTVVHIATHFDSRPGVAANSHMLLGDGEMSLAEIESETRLFDGVDLLTLSACNTAFTNRNEDGREVDSFGTIAQRLGAKGVIASLWSVNDDSTATLMQSMYRFRQESPGQTKDEALRQAQLALLRGTFNPATGSESNGSLSASTYSHPFYWAPFILIGNWK
jgi:CHAT domain-containing protein/Flp pilus assembly protein TadD